MDSYSKMWFGTEDKMQWIDCPLQGADVSPLGWSAEGTFLNGGGYAKHSWGSHRNYVFEWRQSSARRMAQIMHNYRDGVYGRGLIHFVDPLTYDFNILPKQWAYPALMAGEANNPFLRGAALSTVATPTNTFNLPIRGAVVPLGSLSGFRAADSVFIPRPEGKVLQLWGLYTITGNATAGVYAIPVNDNGTNGTPVRLTPTALNGGTPAEYNLTTGKGVRLCVMKTSAASGTVNLFGLVGRLANADGFRGYSWAGTPDNSASIMRDADGTEIARNYATNPSFENPGASVPDGVRPNTWGVSSAQGEFVQSGAWSEDRAFSGKLVRRANPGSALWAEYAITLSAIKPWIALRATVRAPESGATVFPAIQIGVTGASPNAITTSAPSLSGVHTLTQVRSTVGATGTVYFRLWQPSGAAIGEELHFDNVVILQADTEAELQAQIAALDEVGGYFDGDTPTTAPGSAPLTEWLGGQGNSGCRFVGSPTYIENNGVNGGQISYAASFKEIGDWQ